MLQSLVSRALMLWQSARCRQLCMRPRAGLPPSLSKRAAEKRVGLDRIARLKVVRNPWSRGYSLHSLVLMREVILQRSFGLIARASTRLASSSSEAKALSKITGREPPKPPDSTTTVAGQSFPGDLRSTSGLGFGDNLLDHTSKWMQHAQPGQGGNETSPMEYVWRAEPIKVHGAVVASYGSENPALGCPVEYINLKGSSKEHPVVCKYTGNKYYSDDWRGSH